MLELTPLGMFHTAVALIAVAVALVALVRDGAIGTGNQLGKIYIVTTLIACVTAFGIFQHGGFGIPHGLAVLTLLVLAVAALSGTTRLFGAASRYVETVGYSATLLFHLIPGITEAATRLPVGAPLASGPEDPGLQAAAGGLLLLFLIGATLQVRRLRSGGA
jgi:uncharacterized membrane protein